MRDSRAARIHRIMAGVFAGVAILAEGCRTGSPAATTSSGASAPAPAVATGGGDALNPKAYVFFFRGVEREQEGKRLDAALENNPFEPELGSPERTAAVKAWGDAVTEFTRARELDPKSAKIARHRAECLIRLGRVDEGVADLEKAATLDPNDTLLPRSLAAHYERSRKPDKAKLWYETALKRDPAWEAGYEIYADILARTGDFRAAEDVFRRLGLQKGDPVFGSEHLADFHARHGKFDDALREYQALLPGGDRRASLEMRMAVCCERMKKPAEAAAHYKAYFEAGGKALDVRYAYGAALEESGRSAEAMPEYETVIREAADRGPNDPLYLTVLLRKVFLLEHDGRSDEAEAALVATIERGTRQSRIYLLLGSMRWRGGRVGEAVSSFEKSVALDPDDKAAGLQLALALLETGRNNRAEILLRGLIEKNTGDPEISNTLGYLLAEEGRSLAEAEKLVKVAVDVRPDSGAYLDSLGWVYFRMGRMSEAVEILSKAAGLRA
ncbi:MAG: tetratricopeptide repeat protein, partial [Planctomycetota bacterium]